MKWLASIATSGLITVARVNVLKAQTKEPAGHNAAAIDALIAARRITIIAACDI
jgi:hypothetical protein